MSKLKACPFCGEKKEIAVGNPRVVNKERWFYVFCARCEARGPVGDTKKRAGERWNITKS